MGETAYAPCGGLNLAYQVFGDGPAELVVVGPFASHIELFWTLPEFKAFFDQLSTFCRIALFDRRESACLTQSLKFAHWMTERPR